MTLDNYRKLVVAVVGAVLTILALSFDIDVDPEVVAAVTTLLTAAGVWFFPNG